MQYLSFQFLFVYFPIIRYLTDDINKIIMTMGNIGVRHYFFEMVPDPN